MPNRTRTGLAAITAHLHPKLCTVTHRGKPYARFVSDADTLLHVLVSLPSRQLDAFAAQWVDTLSPDEKSTLARHALQPRFLAPDVACTACCLSMRRLTALVDANFDALRGLIRVDSFVDPETNELRQALTLKGAEGINQFLVMVSRQSQPIRGLYRGCVFVRRIAPVVVERQSDEAVSDLVSQLDAACEARLKQAA